MLNLLDKKNSFKCCEVIKIHSFIRVPAEIVQVDLSRAEQMEPSFLKMNPKHEVPVFDHDGAFITQSRDIARYFHQHFNMDPEANDHWYPQDPEERRKVG